MGTLDGKGGIVTGAARGIGKGMATALVKAGCAVTITDILEDVLENTRQELAALPGARVLAFKVDGRDRAGVEAAVRETGETFGTIDILVNNAQAAAKNTPLIDLTKEEIEFAFDTGFYASWYYMVACFPYLKKSQGTVVNFGSDAGIWGNAEQLGYNAAKESIRTLTRTAAREWAKYDITVNSIIPGIETEGGKAFFDKHPGWLEERLARVPRGKLGDAEKDAGGLVTFLATGTVKHITGETFNLNGGVNMRA